MIHFAKTVRITFKFIKVFFSLLPASLEFTSKVKFPVFNSIFCFLESENVFQFQKLQRPKYVI